MAREDMGYFDQAEARSLFESNSTRLHRDHLVPLDGLTGDFWLQVERDVAWLNLCKDRFDYLYDYFYLGDTD